MTTLAYLFFGLWQFLWVWSLGYGIEHRLRLRMPYGYRLACSFALGEIVLSYFYYLLGCFGLLQASILLPLALLCTLVLMPPFLKELRYALVKAWPYIRQSPFASLIIVNLLLFYALGTAVPEREVDSLWYHLAVPYYYLLNGGAIQQVPFNMPSHYPMNVHLHYVFSLLVGNEATAKVFIYCHFFPLLILLWAVVKRYAREEWGLFAVAVYLCCLYFRLPVMVNVQRAVYFYIFLSAVFFWYSFERNRLAYFVLASVFCGMALGTKMSAFLFGLAAFMLLLIVRFFLWRKETFKKAVLLLLLFLGIAGIMYSPWAVKSWLYTGNPMYPMLGEFFPTKEEFVHPMKSNARNHGLNILKSENWHEFFEEVGKNINLVLYKADLIFFLGITAFLLLLLLRRKRWYHPLATMAVFFVLFTMMWGSDTERLFATSYTVLVLLIALAMYWLDLKSRYGKVIYGLILVSLFVTFVQQRYLYLRSENIQWFGGAYLTEESRREWLSSRGIFSEELFRMKDWMDEHIPEDEFVYGYHTVYLYYLRRPYIVHGAHFSKQLDPDKVYKSPLEKWMEEGVDYAAQRLTELDIQWFLWDKERGRLQGGDNSSEWENFKERYLKEVHREGDLILFQFYAVTGNV